MALTAAKRDNMLQKGKRARVMQHRANVMFDRMQKT